MNNVRSITALNDYELQRIARDPAASSSKGSWHDEYRDSAVVFVGGLDSALTEGDVITIFSQYGEVLDINLPKWAQPRPEGQGQGQGQSERERAEAQARVGKRRGFGFLLYEDQRSTILAVDNLNGAQVLGRTLRVDHVKDYRQLEKDEATGKMREAEERRLNAQPVLEGALPKGADGGRGEGDDSSAGSASPAPSIDLEDPMASYFAHQKKSGKKRTKAVEDAEKAAKKARKEERARIREQREQRKREGDRAKMGRDDDGTERSSSRRSEQRESSRRSLSPRRRDYDEREDRYRSHERVDRSRYREGRDDRRYDNRYKDNDYDRARRDDHRR
ncbi:RNA-binding domain-containing protein [Microstroma glucosiphilum]|uniref:RNA-binding domain-containing protein n=1 Tax=Pseudomicrostroma glucosiphilum TaxID=1684307 RepID=A0A316UBV4_9BASI|nr:RNA-binding domain-containing protein [Pseudomicrostroma glucosiphilum]PWN22649.1 RNA-binding domain-containing protein [Pseudomicrostroma glucosiphilum]